MKRKWIVLVVVALLVVLLFPVRRQLKDGGTVEYKALVYKISKVHSLISEEETKKEGKVKPYDEGIVIDLLGFEIYRHIE